MQIPSSINLANLIAAQSSAKAQKQVPTSGPSFAAEAAAPKEAGFEPLPLRKAETPAKPAAQNPFPGYGGARLGSQIDIKI